MAPLILKNIFFKFEEDLEVDPDLVVADLTATDVLEANFTSLHANKGKGTCPWVFDLGASTHLFGDKSQLSEFFPISTTT